MPERRNTFRAAVVAAVAVAAWVLPTRAIGLDLQDFDRIEHGRYLATLSDCEACHNDPVSGTAYGGGRRIETPFGVVAAPNVTADGETGIGLWSDDDFVNALRRGTGRNGSHLYPAMPFPYLTKMSRDDALAIRAYLNTLPSVHHAVKADLLPFPLSIRAGMIAWNAMFFRENQFKPVPGKSDAWNRGAFLVEGPSHCGACHTPKTLLGADKGGEQYQGNKLQGWWAPDLTASTHGGLGGWTTDDIVDYLKTGHNRFAAAAGPMGEEVWLSSSRMADPDLQAIATYLKDLPVPAAPAPAAPIAADDPAMVAGSAIYRDECSACHTPDGHGVPGLLPNLQHLGSVESRDPATVIRVILRGARSVATPGQPTAPAMPSFDWLLTDAQVADVSTYIRNGFGNAAPAVSASDVASARKDLEQRTD